MSGARPADQAALEAHLLAEAESKLVMDVAAHAADRIHEIVKMHATSLPTVSAAIGFGAVVCQQIYAETIQFAANSMDGDEDDELAIRVASRSLIREVFEIADHPTDTMMQGLVEALERIDKLWKAAAFPANVAEAGEIYDALDREIAAALTKVREKIG